MARPRRRAGKPLLTARADAGKVCAQVRRSGGREEGFMSNVFKFDPNAIRERRRLNEKKSQNAPRETAASQARKDSRRAWLLFVGAVILLSIVQAIFKL
jgi:hypothetical protein